jgi:hypothetical protein
MKKNNFFMTILLGVIALLGVNFEARGMESDSSTNKAALVGAGLCAAALVGGYCLTNTATYETYQKDKARKLEEKERSNNPYLYAEPLPNAGLKSSEPGSDKAEAYIREYNKKRDAYGHKATKNVPYWDKKQVIDQYDPNNQ